MEKEITKTQISHIWLESDHIVHAKFLPGAVVTLEKTKEMFNVFLELLGDKGAFFLIDIRKVKSSERESRVFVAKEERPKNLGTAILVNSPVSRVIGNFFMGLNKPPFPVKLVTSEEKAFEWFESLSTHRQSNT